VRRFCNPETVNVETEELTMLNSKTITCAQLAKTIDHSLLRPELTDDEVLAGCNLAHRYHVASVCAKPCHVKLAVKRLAESDVLVGTVIGFPHGSSTTATKVAEAREALANGAVEFDMVIHIGALRSGRAPDVLADIRAVVEAAAGKGIVKVILENAYLTDEQKIHGCKLVEEAGAQFVKTSTGFAPTGATVADIKLMRANVGPKVQVKAAAGIRTLQTLLDMIDAGATRVGATATAAMLDAFGSGQLAEKPTVYGY
jgi:deoxyribose-phosphate aldolase